MCKAVTTFSVAAVCSLFFSFSSIQANESTKRLVVFGDSLAAGTMARTNIGQSLSNDEFFGLVKLFENVIRDPRNGLEPLIKALYSPYSSIDDTAFAGIHEYSFPQRLEDFKHEKIRVSPYAVPGATTSSMASQIKQMVADNTRLDLPPADYVVLHIGGNDWCAKRTDAAFRADLKLRLKEIATNNTNAKILVLPLPPMTKVMGMPDTAAFKTVVAGNEISFQCSRVRLALQTCAARKISLGASDEALAPHLADLSRYNAIVHQVSSVVSREVSTFRGKIAVSEGYENTDSFEPSWLAMDCFHPGKNGHETIADMTWPDMEELVK